jgi:hypothetical protein
MFTAVRLLLLFVHVVSFATALGCVLREDAKLLSRQPFDPDSLQTAARTVRLALILLWVSGLALIAFDTGGALDRLIDKPKLLAKLTVVCVLTLNGVALHILVFPALVGNGPRPGHTASVAAFLGAISAVSWMSATLLGIAPPVAKWWGYGDIVVGYITALALGITFALVVVRPRIMRKLQAGEDCPMTVRAPL